MPKQHLDKTKMRVGIRIVNVLRSVSVSSRGIMKNQSTCSFVQITALSGPNRIYYIVSLIICCTHITRAARRGGCFTCVGRCYQQHNNRWIYLNFECSAICSVWLLVELTKPWFFIYLPSLTILFQNAQFPVLTYISAQHLIDQVSPQIRLREMLLIKKPIRRIPHKLDNRI